MIKSGIVVFLINVSGSVLDVRGPFATHEAALRFRDARIAADRRAPGLKSHRRSMKRVVAGRIETRRTIEFSVLQRMDIAHHSDMPQVVQFGEEVKEYVGIGWVTLDPRQHPIPKDVVVAVEAP